MSKVLYSFVNENEALLDSIKAEVEIGDLTGHGVEWRATVVLSGNFQEENESEDEPGSEEGEGGESEVITAELALLESDGEVVMELQLAVYINSEKEDKFVLHGFSHYHDAEDYINSERFNSLSEKLDLDAIAHSQLEIFIKQSYPVLKLFCKT